MGFPNHKLDRHTFFMVRKCDENAHNAWKALIDKYKVSD